MSEPMVKMIRSETTVPAGGWHYRCAVTGWSLEHPHGGCLDQKIDEVLKHNRANVGKGLTLDPTEIRERILTQTVAHLVSIGANHELMEVPKALAPAAHRLLGPQGIIRRVAEVAANDLLGAKIIADWFGQGGHPVIHEIAEARGNICLACPKNELKERPGIEQIAAVVKWTAGFMNSAKLKLEHEDKLGSCAVCGCVLKTKVWVPAAVIDKDTTHEYPKHCWITKQRENPLPQQSDFTHFSYAENPMEPPSITDQTGWKSGIFHIDHPPGQYWFNAGILMLNGKLYLSSRRMCWPQYRADIVFVEINRDMKALGVQELSYTPTFQNEHMEDGRCIALPGKADRFLLAASNFYISSNQHQALFEVEKTAFGFRVVKAIRIEFAGNAKSIDRQIGMEKNWQFFIHNRVLHFVHWISPTHTVCEVVGEDVVQTWKTDMVPVWAYGRPSGGTPPVRVGNLYWSFFHSSQRVGTMDKKRYFMGAYAFDAKPPFQIRYMSKQPIMAGTRAHPVTLWHHLVVFPMGAIYDQITDEWLVTLGVNDCLNAWVRIPHQHLLQTVA